MITPPAARTPSTTPPTPPTPTRPSRGRHPSPLSRTYPVLKLDFENEIPVTSPAPLIRSDELMSMLIQNLEARVEGIEADMKLYKRQMEIKLNNINTGMLDHVNKVQVPLVYHNGLMQMLIQNLEDRMEKDAKYFSIYFLLFFLSQVALCICVICRA